MTAEPIREIVCTLGQLDPLHLNDATPLSGPLGGSLGRARLDAAIRSRLGVSNPAVYRVKTFGELRSALQIGTDGPAEVEDAALATPASRARLEHSAASGIQIGVDVEAIRSMPTATDFWEHEFYSKTFTRQEIAHALLHASPRVSFAGMWCAKEAFRKIDDRLGSQGWQSVEVTHDKSGKPALLLDGQLLGAAVSISHTDEIAFAAVVLGQTQDCAPVAVDAPVASLTTEEDSRGAPKIFALWAINLVIALSALALALWRH